jgi:hypothetical protein
MADAAPRKPPAPKGLESRGRKFWRDVHATWEFNRDELELVVEVCRLLDTCDRLQAALDDDGVTVRGSTGQTRVHPAVGELRGARLALGRLLAQLGLPDPDEQKMPSPSQERAQRAARARWAHHVKRGGRRGA